MPLVKLKDLKPGMIPVRAIKDRTGRVILEAGRKLTSHQIKTLKAWGITEVVVSEVVPDDAAKVPEKKLQEERRTAPGKSEKELSEIFRFTDRRHPFIKELYASCLERKANKEGAS